MLIQKYFETRLDLIEKGLDSYLSFEDKHASELKEAMRYAVIPGGKRWRPLMLLAIFEMLTGMKKTKVLNDAVLAAVAVESFNTPSNIPRIETCYRSCHVIWWQLF